MRGDPAVIELLNDVLTAELTAINQYFVDAKMLDNWGLTRLGGRFREESIDEMKDADDLIGRILYLDGLPNLQRLGSVTVGEDPVEQLRIALAAELDAITRLRRGVALCTEAGDHGTRDMVAEMLREEEEHADYFETQLGLVERLLADHGHPVTPAPADHAQPMSA